MINKQSQTISSKSLLVEAAATAAELEARSKEFDA